MSSVNVGANRDVLSRKAGDLKSVGCSCGKGCVEWQFQAVCHPFAPLVAIWDGGEGVIILLCSACQLLVIKVKVAT